MPDPTITQVGTTVAGKLFSDAAEAETHLYQLAAMLTAQGMPRVYEEATISVAEGNTGRTVWGNANMAALTDGRTLDTKTFPSSIGPMHDMAAIFLWFETPGDGIDFDGTTR